VIHQIRAFVQQLVLGVDDLCRSFGLILEHAFLSEGAFHDDDVARLGDGEVRLGRYDEAECLQFGADLELPVISGHLQLADVLGAPLRSDRPEHIGQVFRAEARRRGQRLEVCVDRDVTLFALDRGIAVRFWRPGRADEINLGLALSRAEVDGFRLAADDDDSESRSIRLSLKPSER